MKTIRLEVRVTVPDEVLMRDLHGYVRDAVRSRGGQFHPDDPLFDPKDVTVKTLKKAT